MQFPLRLRAVEISKPECAIDSVSCHLRRLPAEYFNHESRHSQWSAQEAGKHEPNFWNTYCFADRVIGLAEGHIVIAQNVPLPRMSFFNECQQTFCHVAYIHDVRSAGRACRDNAHLQAADQFDRIDIITGTPHQTRIRDQYLHPTRTGMLDEFFGQIFGKHVLLPAGIGPIEDQSFIRRMQRIIAIAYRSNGTDVYETLHAGASGFRHDVLRAADIHRVQHFFVFAQE